MGRGPSHELLSFCYCQLLPHTPLHTQYATKRREQRSLPSDGVAMATSQLANSRYKEYIVICTSSSGEGEGRPQSFNLPELQGVRMYVCGGDFFFLCVCEINMKERAKERDGERENENSLYDFPYV